MKKEQITFKLTKLRDLLGIEESEKIAKQIMILAEMLDQYYFTEKQLNNACKKIVEAKPITKCLILRSLSN